MSDRIERDVVRETACLINSCRSLRQASQQADNCTDTVIKTLALTAASTVISSATGLPINIEEIIS